MSLAVTELLNVLSDVIGELNIGFSFGFLSPHDTAYIVTVILHPYYMLCVRR